MSDAIFSVPGLGMVVYPETAAFPLAIAAVVLVLAVCRRLRRREPRWVRDVALGVLVTLVTVGVGALAAFGLSRVLGLLVGAQRLWVWPGSSGLYATAVAMLALAVAAACWELVRRWANPAGAQSGALIVWGAVLLIVTLRLPGASFLLLWPLLAVAGAAWIALSVDRRRVATVVIWAATIVGAAIFVPFIYTVAVVGLAMVAPAPVMIGLFVPLVAMLLAGHLETLTTPRRWVIPPALCTGCVALLALDFATMHPSAAEPQATLLAYALDADTTGAWLVTPPEYARRGSWAAAAVGSAARLVRPRMTAPDAPPLWLTRAITGESPTLVGPAPRVDLAAPEIRVMAESATPEGRRVELRVRPAPGTQSIRLRAVEGNVFSAAVDGRTIDPRHYRRRSAQWTLGYVAPPPDGFALALTVPTGQPVVLDAIARSLGLPPAIQATIPPRPAGVVPIHEGDQTVVRHRVRF